MSSKAKQSKKSNDIIFEQLTDNQHVRLRTGMHLGAKENQEFCEYIINENNILEKVLVYYSPAIYKAIDEIIVNAIDHYTRTKNMDKNFICNIIKCNFNIDNGEIIFYNNGIGIPVKKFKNKDIYIPQVVFTETKTSSNFGDNDNVDRLTGGLNGYGAKLTNILSDYFIIETLDKDNVEYHQVIENGNELINKPTIKYNKGDVKNKCYTKITFKLDYKFCYGKEYDSEIGFIINSLIHSRMVQTAIFCNDIDVYYNDILITNKTLSSIIEPEERKNSISTVLKSNTQIDNIYNVSYDFDVTFLLADGDDNFSIINGIYAKSGGTHISYIKELILSKLKEKIEKLFKGKKITSKSVFNNLSILIKGYVNKPDWKGQQKDELSINKSYFKNYEFTDVKIYDKIWKMLKERLTHLYLNSESKELSKTDGKKKKSVGIEKLFDAEHAGTAKSTSCTLILTEGDSASATAIQGLSKIGREKYGVFPLRGKLLNVREASADKVNNNKEFKNIKEILGLKNNVEYKDLNDLRYGSIMCMTDADSVTGDTPILIKNKNNQLSIIEIQDLHLNQKNIYMKDFSDKSTNPKQYCYISNIEIWTDNGWSKIKHIMKHNTNKNIYRITDKNGSVDVTEDHSLLDSNKNKIKPKELTSDTILLSNEIDLKTGINNYNYYFSILNNSNNNDDKKTSLWSKLLNTNSEQFDEEFKKNNYLSESYLFGIFFHYGYIEKHLYFEFDDEKKYIYTSKLLKNIYNVKFYKAYKNNRYYIKISSDDIENNSLIEKYKMLFYYNKSKKFISPYILFNQNNMIQLKFIMGYLFIDSPYDLFVEKFILNDHNKITIQCCYILLKNIIFDDKKLKSIQISYNNNFDLYEIYINTKEYKYSINRERLITNIYLNNTTVYDIETENHHFHAGIGNLIVHNTDGIHIRGLIINMISYYWPELIDLGFVTSMMTPIVRISKGDKHLNFYSEYDYNKWVSETPNIKSYKIKYYKGLGTIQKPLAIELFSQLSDLRVTYYNDKHANEKIRLGFDKKYADDRKEWLLNYNPNDVKNHLDVTQKNISISEHIDKELIQFSYYDNHRSIPHVLDGFKPSQRKILYTALKVMSKTDLNKEYKVAQFGAEVARITEYHHGETSLFGAIINMAQDYVGSNNYNLLKPLGQFGSRLKGGADHAAPRYIFTNLNELTRTIFNEDDSVLLTYLVVENVQVEPKYYIPIIPMILVNGSKGIGTGFSTTIYPYNINDIIKVIIDKINNRPIDYELTPYFKGYKGTIEAIDSHRFLMTGTYELNKNILHITEIPISTSIEKYKAFLIELETKKIIKSYIENCTTDNISFKVHLNKVHDDIINDFKLSETLNTSNIHCFDANNKIRKFDSVIDIILYHYKYRNKFYIKRKEYILEKLLKDLIILQNKIRFIRAFIAEDIEIRNKTKKYIEDKLDELKFDRVDDTYSYLLNMNLLSLTKEKIKELEKQVEDNKMFYEEYKNKTIKSIWIEELKMLL